jgi:uncharacterized 2Fe-2S/4Fe-4S cluster protein (DUF4445 family)
MPELTVRVAGGEQRLTFIPGLSLKQMLEATRFPVKARCNGNGACGLCRVRIDSGRVNPPTGNERVYLDADSLGQGMRLACQVYPEEDLGIQVVNRESVSTRQNILPDETLQPLDPGNGSARELAVPLPGALGLAVDLGTTHLKFSLCDLAGKRRLALRCCPNPQLFLGGDVITRLTAASGSPEKARAMQSLIMEAIGAAAREMTAQLGAGPGQIVRLTLVGNSAMLALLTGINFALLMQPSHWTEQLNCIPDSVSFYAAAWNLHPGAEIEIIPPLGGFIGSDLLAGLIAVKLLEREPGSLYLDFGTNTEIALWDGKALLVTSAAGGPAFEASGIQCGMLAEEGAIHAVDIAPDTGELTFKVLMDADPAGICGSGFIDLVACLLRAGKLTDRGSLEPGNARQGFLLAQGPAPISVNKHDIDLFQRAKGAVMAGIRVLHEASQMEGAGVRRVFVGGSFGSSLRVTSAQEIGLLPLIPAGQIRLSGNAALNGCEQLMLFSESGTVMDTLRSKSMLVNLANSPSFSEFYFESLYLKPVTVGVSHR